jgi:hypothetical protein
MYLSPRITDFGRIEIHTYAFANSSGDSPDEVVEATGGGGGGVGLIGLIGGAIALAGRGNDESTAAVPPEDEEEKANLK